MLWFPVFEFTDPVELVHTGRDVRKIYLSVLGGCWSPLRDPERLRRWSGSRAGAFPELLRIYHLLGEPALKLR